jgi:hypothetical protein
MIIRVACEVAMREEMIDVSTTFHDKEERCENMRADMIIDF